MEILNKAIQKEGVFQDPAPVIAIKEYNAQNVVFGAMVWCATEDYWDLKFSINRELSALCREAGITFYAPKLKVEVEK